MSAISNDWPELHHIGPVPEYEPVPDWHAVDTIQLGELIEDGVIDLSAPDMAFDAYDTEQAARLISKIQGRFYWREISVLPIKRWKMEYVRLLNEIMPKYKPLYKRIAEGIDPFANGSEWGKHRDIFSEFPQTQLAGNSDYASTGTDREYEIIREGDIAERAAAYARNYRDVDALILDELEKLFSPLATVGAINAY